MQPYHSNMDVIAAPRCHHCHLACLGNLSKVFCRVAQVLLCARIAAGATQHDISTPPFNFPFFSSSRVSSSCVALPPSPPLRHPSKDTESQVTLEEDEALAKEGVVWRYDFHAVLRF